MAQTRSQQDYGTSFTAYMAQARKIPFLTAEEEFALAEQIKLGGRVGERARDKLVMSQLRFVVKLAYKQVRPNVSLEDLVQEGNLGLFRAADGFDASKGFRFFTYARWWVMQSLNACLDNNGYAVKLPARGAFNLGKINRAITKLTSLSGSQPSDEEVAREVRLPVETVRALCEFAQSPVSINAPIFDGDAEVGDRIADTSLVSAEDTVVEDDFKSKITDALSILNEREKAVLVGRFGLDGEGEKTLEDLAQVYGITRERIRQIEVKAKEKLAKGATGSMLKSFLR
jgi:RNA polymerase primary sigma factor